jgi:formylglycine-generating enzyme required for sulfatase activity
MKSNEHRHPLYWRSEDGGWREFTLAGLIPLDPNLPVIHISLFEADAYARWAGARLPSEAEWEHAASQQEIDGCFADNNRFHPCPAGSARPDAGASPRLDQLYGDAWEWTQSSYSPYPGYNPAKPNENEPMSVVWDEAVGEYNSRSMVNQYVLRGGSCAIPRERIRASFRNFFPASTCWQFSGIRLARDAAK